jgi:uncharacterized protein (TIGR03083 family)
MPDAPPLGPASAAPNEPPRPAPILCAHLIRKVDAQLLELLPALRPDEWALPTVAREWTVRDVAAHLLDTVLRKLSAVRDNSMVENVQIRSYQDVLALVNGLNREGVTVYRRLSPAVLCDLMALACRESADFHEALDPFARAAWNVSWAGEDHSLNWFDTARELTERWHHQQQIRLATNRPGIMTPELYHPVLDCFVRGLPFSYANVEAALGAAVRLDISGECGGQWQIRRNPSSWALEIPTRDDWTARVIIPQEIAWRIFTKGITRAAALEQVRVEGQRDLALPVLDLNCGDCIGARCFFLA